MGNLYDDKDVMRLLPLSNPSPETAQLIDEIKTYGQTMWLRLDRLPSNREVAIAKTKLEEVVMWAVKGITR